MVGYTPEMEHGAGPGNDHVLYSKNSLFHVFVKGLFQGSMLVFKV